MINDYVNKIIKGDCIDILKKIPDNSIDLIFADPPYFMQTENELLRFEGTKFEGVEDEWDKFKNYEEYDKFCLTWLKECYRILKKNGSIWVIGSFQNIYRIGYIMQNIGYWIINDIIWSKPNAVPNFKGTRFKNSHETILWCCKNKFSKYTFNYKTMKFLNSNIQDKSIWDISICIGNERIKNEYGKKAHSTQKPEQLLYKIILSSSKVNDIILDPFFGTGTTGAIAKKLGRKFIGIEKEIQYIKVAENRISNIISNPSDIEKLCLEVKPPKLPIKKLMENNYIITGEKLYNKKGDKFCYILDNGNVTDNDEILSIHKMAAKLANKISCNGWDYFFVKRDNNLISINDFRYDYNKKESNNE